MILAVDNDEAGEALAEELPEGWAGKVLEVKFPTARRMRMMLLRS